MNQDLDHLNLLKIFHYIFAGLQALCGCFPIIHFVVGIGVLTGGMGQGEEGAAIAGVLFVVIACFAMLLMWGLAVAVFFAGRFLGEQRNWTYCIVVAALLCTNFPLGTVLGVFTILVLSRPAVKEMFEGKTMTGGAGTGLQ